MCHPRTRGRPGRNRALSDSTPSPDLLNPEHAARAHHDYAQNAAEIESMPVVEVKDSMKHASQAHILKVMELMGCDEGHESSVLRLPYIDIRCNVQGASDIDTAGLKMCFGVVLKLGRFCLI